MDILKNKKADREFVRKIEGKGLSTEDFTTAEKTKLAGLSEHDKGFFANEAAIIAAIPAGQAGWFVRNGETDTVWLWDVEGEAWVDSGSAVAPETGASLPAVIIFDESQLTSGVLTVSSAGVYFFMIRVPSADVTVNFDTLSENDEVMIINGMPEFNVNVLSEETGINITVTTGNGVSLRALSFMEMIILYPLFQFQVPIPSSEPSVQPQLSYILNIGLNFEKTYISGHKLYMFNEFEPSSVVVDIMTTKHEFIEHKNHIAFPIGSRITEFSDFILIGDKIFEKTAFRLIKSTTQLEYDALMGVVIEGNTIYHAHSSGLYDVELSSSVASFAGIETTLLHTFSTIKNMQTDLKRVSSTKLYIGCVYDDDTLPVGTLVFYNTDTDDIDTTVVIAGATRVKYIDGHYVALNDDAIELYDSDFTLIGSVAITALDYVNSTLKLFGETLSQCMLLVINGMTSKVMVIDLSTMTDVTPQNQVFVDYVATTAGSLMNESVVLTKKSLFFLADGEAIITDLVFDYTWTVDVGWPNTVNPFMSRAIDEHSIVIVGNRRQTSWVPGLELGVFSYAKRRLLTEEEYVEKFI